MVYQEEWRFLIKCCDWKFKWFNIIDYVFGDNYYYNSFRLSPMHI